MVYVRTFVRECVCVSVCVYCVFVLCVCCMYVLCAACMYCVCVCVCVCVCAYAIWDVSSLPNINHIYMHTCYMYACVSE